MPLCPHSLSTLTRQGRASSLESNLLGSPSPKWRLQSDIWQATLRATLRPSEPERASELRYRSSSPALAGLPQARSGQARPGGARRARSLTSSRQGCATPPCARRLLLAVPAAVADADAAQRCELPAWASSSPPSSSRSKSHLSPGPARFSPGVAVARSLARGPVRPHPRPVQSKSARARSSGAGRRLPAPRSAVRRATVPAGPWSPALRR